MAIENSKQSQTRPWQPPVVESAEEKSKREQREQQTRFFVECIKQAFREVADEHKDKEGEDFFSSLFK